MAQATGHPRKQVRRERQRAAAEARTRVRSRRTGRRALGYLLGGAALIAGVTLAIVATSGEHPGLSVGPSQPSEVSVSGPARTAPLGAGDPVPSFSAPEIGGGTVSWSDFSDRPVVLAVWAPWCPHCQAELPLLGRVMRDYPGVAFLTVVTSIGDHPGPDPGAFLRDHGIGVSTAVDDSAGTLAGALGIRGFPTLYFVGTGGTVVRGLEGEVDETTLRAVIESLT